MKSVPVSAPVVSVSVQCSHLHGGSDLISVPKSESPVPSFFRDVSCPRRASHTYRNPWESDLFQSHSLDTRPEQRLCGADRITAPAMGVLYPRKKSALRNQVGVESKYDYGGFLQLFF